MERAPLWRASTESSENLVKTGVWINRSDYAHPKMFDKLSHGGCDDFDTQCLGHAVDWEAGLLR